MADDRTDRTLRLALLGYGKMGKAIEAIAPERGCRVQLILDEYTNAGGQGITRESFDGVDVCLDFTTPEAAVENIRRVATLGCNLVVGTTGWQNHLAEVRRIVEHAAVGMVYGANFSIGVQLFYRAAKHLAEQFRAYPAYEPYIHEAHHRLKKDAPSGTALELKLRVESALDRREVAVNSTRAGYIPGTHELGFDSEGDTIILRHTARGRRGFAEGALLAARWITGKRGLYQFAEILE